MPFAIQNEATAERFLTGIDFDPNPSRSWVTNGGSVTSSAPMLLRVTPQGKVLGVIETVGGGKAYRSPDHYMNGRLPNYPGDASFEVRRSGGLSPWPSPWTARPCTPCLSGLCGDATTKAQEMHKGKPYTRILELDAASKPTAPASGSTRLKKPATLPPTSRC